MSILLCVNAFHRASFISILTFWSPLFMRLLSFVFAPFSSCLQVRHILFCLFDFSFLIFSILLFYSSEKPFLKILFPTTPKGQQETFFHLKLFNQPSIFKQGKQLVILVRAACVSCNAIFIGNFFSICKGTVYAN